MNGNFKRDQLLMKWLKEMIIWVVFISSRGVELHVLMQNSFDCPFWLTILKKLDFQLVFSSKI